MSFGRSELVLIANAHALLEGLAAFLYPVAAMIPIDQRRCFVGRELAISLRFVLVLFSCGSRGKGT